MTLTEATDHLRRLMQENEPAYLTDSELEALSYAATVLGIFAEALEESVTH